MCELDGKSINPSHGGETAGKSGMMRCKNKDTGHLQREQELQNGRFMGLERMFDNQGRIARERHVNDRGNSHGRVAEFWPNGKLRRESFANNGRAEGAVRSFAQEGQPARLAFVGEGGRELFLVEYNPAGQPTRLTCHSASVVPEDQALCGFSGPADTLLYNERGQRVGQMRYERGQLVHGTEWAADDTMAAQILRESGQRVYRRYSSEAGKAVLREERRYTADDRPLTDRRGDLAQVRRWGASGQLIEQVQYSGGREVLLERWYLNGSARERVARVGEGAQVRIQSQSHDDTGRITRREEWTAEKYPTGSQLIYHPSGRPATEEIYSEPDERGRTRLLRRKTWDESGKLLSDDAILEDGSRQRKPQPAPTPAISS